MNLVEALDAATGTVCVVGAGGKKSTLFALAARLECAVVTATVRIPIFDSAVATVSVTEDPVSTLRTADQWPVGVVPAREGSDRYRGYDPSVVDSIAAASEAPTVLVKADGARMREFKAPGPGEPVIPKSADTILPVASARVVGKPLTVEHVHRPKRVADITGLALGDSICTTDVAAVISSDVGGRKDIPASATVIPVINKVDNGNLQTTAREVAQEIHARTNVPHVALTQMTASKPLIEVVG